MQSKTSSKKYCKRIQVRFSEYVDGVLSENERLEVHQHVSKCRVCSHELDQLCRTLALLVDFKEECIPAAIQTYRLPRFTFLEIFPSIREQKDWISMGELVPYLTALILFFIAISTWNFAEQVAFRHLFNDSNYVEVIGKI
jgi:hypothetical protein